MDIIEVSSSNPVSVQKYSTTSLESFLKQKGEPKEYEIINNDQKHLSSPAWTKFGFPAKRVGDDAYQRIDGFASCFNCKSTYSYQSDGSGSTKHLLRYICSKASLSTSVSAVNIVEAPIDKFTQPKTASSSIKLSIQDSMKIRDKFTKWFCSSIRPFNMITDPGLKDTLQIIVDMCRKYRCPIDIDDVLVSATTISTNVAKLAHDYRSLIKPILIRQAECGALTVCPDLWTDNYQKINYLGLTIYFVDSNYKLYSFDLCCSRFNEVDKTGASVLRALRKQLDLFGLLPYMDNHNITFTTDRGSNILKALKDKRLTTTPSKNKLKQVEYTDDTYSDDSSSEDDVPTPSPSKYIEANTIMPNLSTKAKEVLITIATSKKLVKYAKITGLNKVIHERGGVALKQECIVRWLSMSNMLESIDTSIEHIRACLSSKTNYSFKLNNISQDVLKDLIVLLSEFKNVSTLVQTGSRPTLHIAYISMNILANHLNGTDVNNDGEIIQIFDRHDGIDFFRKRWNQLLKSMFTFDDRHLAAAILYPMYRRLTFATSY
ncbi:unnamed protein product [Rotaria magnacalcarata]|uniref:Hermes trasposase DNA-binding domain-containing protein n=2 Tax=Rotaria magnacalcarata TaxID=392030 RepID=A0A8S2W1D6_9BILA|nr:unnamed protein product [Rotaria magnacalcarata]